ncbi:MAG TPA: hypothetical protein VGW10_17070, partial [Solirubrobacteraceae bacterium]|nr:hypothetical protein [Solirubrobacteraceae bacterium]
GLDHAATVPYLCLVVGVPGLVYAATFAARAGAKSVRTAGFVVRLGPGLLDANRRRRAGRRHAFRSGAAALRREITPRTAGVAAGMVGAFGLALAALSLTDPAPVAAIREGSVVIAAFLAPRMLGESGGRARIAGAAAVFAGVVAVAAG